MQRYIQLFSRLIFGLLLTSISFNSFAAEKIVIIVSGAEKQIYLPVKLAER